jgi:hypothetical protein
MEREGELRARLQFPVIPSEVEESRGETRTLVLQRDPSTPLRSAQDDALFTKARHIFSGTLMPNKSRPRCKTRPVRSHKASREPRAGSSDLKTGQAS